MSTRNTHFILKSDPPVKGQVTLNFSVTKFPLIFIFPVSPQGSYSLPQSQFYLPYMDLPYWLTNGNYRVQGILGGGGKELGCLKLSLSIHSN